MPPKYIQITPLPPPTISSPPVWIEIRAASPDHLAVAPRHLTGARLSVSSRTARPDPAPAPDAVASPIPSPDCPAPPLHCRSSPHPHPPSPDRPRAPRAHCHLPTAPCEPLLRFPLPLCSRRRRRRVPPLPDLVQARAHRAIPHALPALSPVFGCRAAPPVQRPAASGARPRANHAWACPAARIPRYRRSHPTPSPLRSPARTWPRSSAAPLAGSRAPTAPPRSVCPLSRSGRRRRLLPPPPVLARGSTTASRALVVSCAWRPPW
nr:proline-rich receptor-like protein kinase PERK9 [Aegilops tauschii subsp. strangulata]